MTLPLHTGVAGYTVLWDSSHDDIREVQNSYRPGAHLSMGGTSMLLLRAEQAQP